MPEWNNHFRERCRRLLEQQCRQWGQDVRSPAGNLLEAYGFTRIPAPPGIVAHSRYQLRLSARSTITLWSFGLYYARCGRGGLFLERSEGRPRFGHEAGFLEKVWTREMVPLSCAPVCENRHQPDLEFLLPRAVDWVSRYERWVLDRWGIEYRHWTLREWPDVIPPADLPAAWQQLGRPGPQVLRRAFEESPELAPK